jgi:hypothetical protein
MVRVPISLVRHWLALSGCSDLGSLSGRRATLKRRLIESAD